MCHYADQYIDRENMARSPSNGRIDSACAVGIPRLGGKGQVIQASHSTQKAGGNQ
jgi:hypothetical protein